LEENGKDMQQSILGIERSRESLSADLTELAQKIGQFEERTTSAEEKTVSQNERRHYEVRPGDTLYRISQKYGISVDELRRLNGLAPDHVIHPGQKLIIRRGNDQ
jgi:LysM repeat protein